MDIRVRPDPTNVGGWLATSDELPGVEVRGQTAQDAVTNAANLIGRLRAADAVELPVATPVLEYRPAGLRPPPLPPSPPSPPAPWVEGEDETGGLFFAIMVVVIVVGVGTLLLVLFLLGGLR
ncbi:MAG TPA: hypothetical protein VGB55_05005 [Tepidisphaeraceae bacterium]|jgi:predicted RNase H-like HicB family nuclease